DYRDDLKIKKIKKNLASFLDDVELEMFTFEQDDTELLLELAKNNIEFVKVDFDIMLKTKYDLYRFLNLLGYSEYDFVHIGDVVTQNRGNLVTKFINTISDSLLIGDKTGKVTEGFMAMRGAMEHSSACIFPENIGKAVSDYSWRETMVKRLYLARKVELEEFYKEQAKQEARNKKT
ncbi:MAG: hypothetical protein ACRCRT_06900, partial [Cetobacterium somerae]